MLDIGLIVKAGIVVGSCVSVPFAIKSLVLGGEEQFTKNNVSIKTVVQETGDLIGPIFDCNANKTNYKVYLVPDKEKVNRKGGGEENISLQVISEENNTNRKIVWSPETGKENKWIKWNIDIIDQIIQLLPGVTGKDSYGQTATCPTNKVVLKEKNHYGRFWEVEDGNKKAGAIFKVDLQSCQNKEECNIVFPENSFFQWNPDFQPKINIPFNKK